MILLWILIIFGWTFAMMVLFFYVLKLCSLLRISLGGGAFCPGLYDSKNSPGHALPGCLL